MIDLEELRDVRKRKGISQENIAHFLNISQPAYNQIENGKTRITANTVEQVCQFLEIPVTDLLKEKYRITIQNNEFSDQSAAFLYQAKNDNQSIELLKEVIESQKVEIEYLRTQNQKLLELMDR